MNVWSLLTNDHMSHMYIFLSPIFYLNNLTSLNVYMQVLYICICICVCLCLCVCNIYKESNSCVFNSLYRKVKTSINYLG